MKDRSSVTSGQAPAAKPWGWDVLVTFHGGRTEKFHKAGTAKGVRRWAMLKTLAKSAEILDGYTREQWIRVWGDGRLRM